MNFFNRALKNITRKLSKSVLLMLTFFVIGNFVIVGLGVSNAASDAKIMTRQKMRAVVSYEVDYQAFWEWADNLEDEEERNQAYQNYPYISNEEITTLLNDERVKTVNALTTSQLYSDGFEAVPLGNKYEENNNSGGISSSCYIDADGQEVCEEYEYIEANLKVQANSFPDMIEFSDNMYEIKDGRMYTQSEIESSASVCLITDTLAELNNLRVGDTIRVMIASPSEVSGNGYYARAGLTKEDVTLELEIIGIFDNKEEADPTAENFDWMSKYESPENIILMPDTTYSNILYNMNSKMWEYQATQFPDDEYYQNEENRPSKDTMMRKSSITILLNDPLEVDPFVEEMTASLTVDYRKLDANNDTFNQLARPLDTLSLFASFIVWLVIINAVIIITLVTALTLKTREYEIGVLLAQGVSKFKIVLQFFVELAAVAIVGFTLSVLSGSMIASKVGESVLAYQVDLSGVDELGEEDDNYYGWDTNYFSEVSLDDIVEQYEVTISPMIIAEIYIAGLGIVLVSILIPSLMIMRFNPKRILMSAQ